MKATMNNWRTWVPETRPEKLRAHYEDMLLHAGFCILDITEHHFQPYGYTALFLLSESHFAIHTFPEEGKTYLELSSCVDGPYVKFCTMFEAALAVEA